MNPTRTFPVHALAAVVLVLLGTALWLQHLRAWDLGGRSPILGYDTAQYALAARELADHGRLATTFALPVELVHHPRPPWPLAVVQPGLVIAEAALFALPLPRAERDAAQGNAQAASRDARERRVLVLPLLAYLATGVALALAGMRLLARHAPDLPVAARVAAGLALGAGFLLDPEAQHFASGGYTEAPFTLGLALALVALASGWAPAHPAWFGVLLGVTGSFRANMLWLAPLFALGAAALAPPGRRGRTLGQALGGWVLIGAPWWIYKWRSFGTPAWDLTRWVIWDGVEGRSWFSIFHQARLPELPGGIEALRLLLAKVTRTLPGLVLASFTGPRALWIGALLVGALATRGTRPLAIAAWVTLVAFGVGLLAAASTIPWLRYLFPSRVLVEAAGLFALWGLIARAAGPMRGAALVGGALAALLTLGWGAWQTTRGLAEARLTAERREVPSSGTIDQVIGLLDRELAPAEPVMSNLGPILAWGGGRPVVHLALTPIEIEDCRRRLDFRNVLLVYRDAARAGPEWGEVVARPEEAPRRPEWNVQRSRLWASSDGFRIVWLELGPVRGGAFARR